MCDLEEIDAAARKGLEFIPVRHVSEVLACALTPVAVTAKEDIAPIREEKLPGIDASDSINIKGDRRNA